MFVANHVLIRCWLAGLLLRGPGPRLEPKNALRIRRSLLRSNCAIERLSSSMWASSSSSARIRSGASPLAASTSRAVWGASASSVEVAPRSSFASRSGSTLTKAKFAVVNKRPSNVLMTFRMRSVTTAYRTFRGPIIKFAITVLPSTRSHARAPIRSNPSASHSAMFTTAPGSASSVSSRRSVVGSIATPPTRAEAIRQRESGDDPEHRAAEGIP